MKDVKELIEQLKDEESKGYSLNLTDESLTNLYSESKPLTNICAFSNSSNIVKNCLSEGCKLDDTKIRSTNLWDIILLSMFNMIKVSILFLKIYI